LPIDSNDADEDRMIGKRIVAMAARSDENSKDGTAVMNL
jgi:hypothetical protein